MQIKQLHKRLIMPTKGSSDAGAYDIYMPESGSTAYNTPTKVHLGFSTAVPVGYVALLLPRSSIGAKFGLELTNSCGVIDSDYRGEWLAVLQTKNPTPYAWNAGDRVLQFLLMPVWSGTIEEVDELSDTVRGTGGFGSTGM